MHFGENQLSRYSMSFSLLNTGHRKVLQHLTVRPSSMLSHTFSLPMPSSYRFGSINTNYIALFRLGFPTAPTITVLTLLVSITRQPIRQQVRGHRIGSHSIVSKEFQDLFHSPIRGSFHRSLTVLCTIGVKKYLVLDRGRPGFTPDFSCPTLLRN